jgi:hypothetical protein
LLNIFKKGHPTEKVLKGVDKDRYKTLQSANLQLSEADQFCFYIIRADLKYQENKWNPYSLKIKAKQLKKKRAVFTRQEEEDLGDKEGIMVRKSIAAHGWYDANGTPLFEINPRMPVEFHWSFSRKLSTCPMRSLMMTKKCRVGCLMTSSLMKFPVGMEHF